MKGRIVRYAKYKAWGKQIITCRVSPRNTSRECARCGALVIRYAQGQPEKGYTSGAPLVLCPDCLMRGHADRNASVVVGQRLITRYTQSRKEKPQARLSGTGRVVKATGVVICQDAQSEGRPSISPARHADHHEHGTAQGGSPRMDEHPPSISHQLRLFTE